MNCPNPRKSPSSLGMNFPSHKALGFDKLLQRASYTPTAGLGGFGTSSAAKDVDI